MKIAKHLLMLNMGNHATSTTHRIRVIDWVFICSSDMMWNT